MFRILVDHVSGIVCHFICRVMAIERDISVSGTGHGNGIGILVGGCVETLMI